MKSMTNRLAELAGAVTLLPIADTTPAVLGKLVRARPKVHGYTLLEDGDVDFSISLHVCKVTPTTLSHARHLRTRWFADLLGGFLVRTNFDTFSELIDRAEFPTWAKGKWHGGFGLWVGEEQLRFRFHATLLNTVWNEHLCHELKGVA